MKRKLLLLFLFLLVLNGCRSYPDAETFTCNSYSQLNEYYGVELEEIYEAEHNYIVKIERIARVKVDDYVENMIEGKYEGDREAFSRALSEVYQPQYYANPLTIKFIDKDTYFEYRNVFTAPEIVRDWRTLILPSNVSLEDVKMKLSTKNVCKP